MDDLNLIVAELEFTAREVLGYQVPVLIGPHEPALKLTFPQSIYLPWLEREALAVAAPYMRAFVESGVAHLKSTFEWMVPDYYIVVPNEGVLRNGLRYSTMLVPGEFALFEIIEDGRVNQQIDQTLPGLAFAEDCLLRTFRAENTPPIVQAALSIMLMARGHTQNESIDRVGGGSPWVPRLLKEVRDITTLLPDMARTSNGTFHALAHARRIYHRWIRYVFYAPEVTQSGSLANREEEPTFWLTVLSDPMLVKARSMLDPPLSRLTGGIGGCLARAIKAIARPPNTPERPLYTAWRQRDETVQVDCRYEPAADALLAAGRVAAQHLSQRVGMDLLHPHLLGHRPHGTSPDVALTLLISHSHSMHQKTKEGASKIVGAMLLALLCAELTDRLCIPLEVLGFTTCGRDHEFGTPGGFERSLPLKHLIFKDFSQTFDETKFGFHRHAGENEMHRTVDGEAIGWAAHRLLQRPEGKRVLWVLSDGPPDAEWNRDLLLTHLRQTVAQVERRGIEITGVGIESDHVTSLYSHWRTIESVDELISWGIERIVSVIKRP